MGYSSSGKVSVRSIQHIVDKLCRQQMRDSTAKTYYSVWKQFNAFLITLDTMPKFWEDRTVLFVAHLIDIKKFQSSSVKSYISAIKRTLIDDNYLWCDNKVMLNSLTCACKISNDRVTTKLPIHCGLLEVMLFDLERMYGSQPYLETLFKSIFALGYYGLMQIGELTMGPHVLKAKNVHLALNKEKLLLILYTSKTHDKGSYPQNIKITENRMKNPIFIDISVLFSWWETTSQCEVTPTAQRQNSSSSSRMELPYNSAN